MQIETPPTEKPYEKSEGERRGLVIVNTGDGKGKSTAAFGLALRAHGRGKKVKATILSGDYFMVTLDEITYPLIYGWMQPCGGVDDVLQTLKTRPSHVHVVLTGRRCPPEIIELADTVTEMTMVKHAFKAGVPAQRGIED
jgi:cob(I)alamin adenosyltransferase